MLLLVLQIIPQIIPTRPAAELVHASCQNPMQFLVELVFGLLVYDFEHLPK